MNHTGLTLKEVTEIHFSINLCRLCKWNPNHCEERRMIEVLDSDVTGYSLSAVISTFLNVTFEPHDIQPNKICENCYQIICTWIKLVEDVQDSRRYFADFKNLMLNHDINIDDLPFTLCGDDPTKTPIQPLSGRCPQFKNYDDTSTNNNPPLPLITISNGESLNFNDQPSTNTGQPFHLNNQPSISTHQPSHFNYQPSTSTGQPSSFNNLLSTSTGQPLNFNNLPLTSTSQPSSCSNLPTTSNSDNCVNKIVIPSRFNNLNISSELYDHISNSYSVDDLGKTFYQYCSICKNSKNCLHYCPDFNKQFSTCLVPYCTMLFRSNKDFNVHLQKHFGLTYKQKFCNVCYENSSIDDEHVHFKKKIFFKCYACNYNFKTMLELAYHKLSKHNGLLQDFKLNFICLYCEYTFSSIGEVNNHMLVDHKTEISQTKNAKLKCCTYCGKKINVHIYKTHLDECADAHKNNFPCELCKKYYTSLSYLQHHNNIHHSSLKINVSK